MNESEDLLFAEHAVRLGVVSQEALDESRGVQARMAEMGVHESLWNVLVKRGVLKEADASVVARKAGIRSARDPIPGLTLEKRLGTGAMGSVYRAFQQGMKRHVAVKILRRDLTDDPRQVERLQREAALVGKLNHPNIVRGLASGESGGLVWFLMEYVDGETLHEAIRRQGRIPLEQALEITQKMAEALEHAHAHGVVHRDIKPGNVLLTKEGEPRLSDYGLAKGESDDALTQVDATLGTPQYIAPEQAKNPRDADIRSDIYSLGATLYAMLAGRPPFSGETVAATLTKVLYQRPRPLHEMAAGLPPEVGYLVERMMAKDRRYRYDTPTELLKDVRALRAGRLQVPRGFQGDIVEFVEARKQRRQWVLFGGIIAGALVVSLSLMYFEQRSKDQRLEEQARVRLADVLERPGPQRTWSPRTVESMVQDLDEYLRRYPTSPVKDAAHGALEGWRRQADALQRVGRLRIKAADFAGSRARLLDEIEEEGRRLRAEPDSSVAMREYEDLLSDERRRRDREAASVLETGRAEAASRTLDGAAQRLAELAQTIRREYFGEEPSDVVSEAAALAERFAAAERSLATHFAPYDDALAAVEGPDLPFQELMGALATCHESALGDPDLVRLLGSLPPVGERSREPTDRYREREERLRSACRVRAVQVSQDAWALRGTREYTEAQARLQRFESQALEPERSEAARLRREFESEEMQGLLRLWESTGAAARDYLDAVGRRTYGEAGRVLDRLGVEAREWPGDKDPADTFVTAGRLLLGLIESHAWEPLREHLRANRRLDAGLKVGTIRHAASQIERVRIEGADVVLQLAAGITSRKPVLELAVEDVLRYSAPDTSTPEGAVVFAALRLTEYEQSDPNAVVGELRDLEGILDTAEKRYELGPVVERLRELWRARLSIAADRAGEREREAIGVRRAARAAMEEGDFAVAVESLERLLGDKRLFNTDYVLARREELNTDLAVARQALKDQGFAAFFPGARMTRLPDGRTEIVPDLADGRLAALVGLEPGVTEVGARARIPAVAAALQPGEETAPVSVPVLQWRRWDGEPARHPRGFPVRLENPFVYRKPIDVTFRYRTDAPYALMLSVSGATAGVLSAGDDREGGQGARVWHADDLDRPDEAFGDRHRPSREGDGTASPEQFAFAPGRVYRVRLEKSERQARLWVDGRLVADGEIKPVPTGSLAPWILLLSYTSGEVDDLRVVGTLDPQWVRRKR